MTKVNVLEKTPLTLSETKHLMAHDEETELTFRAQRTFEYLNSLAVVDVSKIDDFKSKLLAIGVPLFKDIMAIKMIDLMPKSVPEVKYILSSFSLVVPATYLTKILAVVDDFRI